MSDRIPISIEIGLPGIDETLKKLEALKSNLRTLGEREAEVPVGAPRIREIAPAAVISTGQLQNLTRAMAEQIGVGRISGATFEDLNDMMKSVGLSGRQQRMIWEMLASGMDETGEKAGALATHYAYVNRRLGEIRDQQRSFMAMLGPTGVGVMRLSRSLFWLGLGSMFITMSWSLSLIHI